MVVYKHWNLSNQTLTVDQVELDGESSVDVGGGGHTLGGTYRRGPPGKAVLCVTRGRGVRYHFLAGAIPTDIYNGSQQGFSCTHTAELCKYGVFPL